MSAYTSSDRRRLNNFAIPTDAQELLSKLRQEQCTSSSQTYHTNITVEQPEGMCVGHYCYPDRDWTSIKSLKDLHSQHKMLSSKHFDTSAYTSSDRRRLNNFAISTAAQILLIK